MRKQLEASPYNAEKDLHGLVVPDPQACGAKFMVPQRVDPGASACQEATGADARG
ncbi:hypothetical protein KOI35_39450 [Actinoplanes bogorensis]|uniref:Uncharacterized protein n=1 Tax=Paractinoplanes bogorensis TaxID=1610840 RepID=A0ABS5Z3U3_9ACTN|nr:hypothetical protein [Actinoplanes bogorensis]MBU2669604.1 hypothetical protein [Actinoplanes bogorensis]